MGKSTRNACEVSCPRRMISPPSHFSFTPALPLLSSRQVSSWSKVSDATTRSTVAFADLCSSRKLSSRPARQNPGSLSSSLLTCPSHIFCLPCAEKSGLTTTPKEQRNCPTCKSKLPNSYDVVNNLLDPPDDFRASVLAGLSPGTIIECAQKALSFWTYQNAQEQ